MLQVNILIPRWDVRDRVWVAKGSSSFDSQWQLMDEMKKPTLN